MEGKIDMSARRQATNKLREAYQGASKPDKGRLLERCFSPTETIQATVPVWASEPRSARKVAAVPLS